MPIQQTSLSYRESARFNISKMFQEYFDNGKTIDSLILNSIDFTEISEKMGTFSDGKKNHTISIKESIAKNLISCLDPEVYLPYINSSWLARDSYHTDSGPINHLLFFQKYDVIKSFLDVTFTEAISENEFEGSKSKTFRTECIGLILNLPHQLDNFSRNAEARDTESMQKYFDLFVYSLDKYQEYTKKVEKPAYFQFRKEQDPQEPIDLIKHLQHIYHECNIRFHRGLSDDNWLNHLFETPKYFKFLDLLGTAKNYYLFKPQHLETAIEHNNTKVINYWLSHDMIKSSDVQPIINKNINHFIDNIFQNYSKQQVINTINSIIKTCEFLEKKGIFSIDLIEEKNLFFFFLDKPNIFSKQILEKNPNIFNNLEVSSLNSYTFINPISVKNLIAYNNLATEFIKTNNYEIFPPKSDSYSNKESQTKFFLESISPTNLISQLLANNYFDFITNDPLTDKDYEKFTVNFSEESTSYLTASHGSLGKLKTEIDYFLYQKTLIGQNTLNKKVKI